MIVQDTRTSTSFCLWVLKESSYGLAAMAVLLHIIIVVVL